MRAPSTLIFNRCPLLWLATLFAAGILAAAVLEIDLRVLVAVGTGLALLAILVRRHPAATYIVLFAFAVAGALSYRSAVDGTASNRISVLYDNGTVRSNDPVEIEGVMAGAAEPSVSGVYLILNAERLGYKGREMAVSGRVRLFVPSEDQPGTLAESEVARLRYGSRIRVALRLEREDAYLNPGVVPKRELLRWMGLDATGVVKSHLLIEHVADESVFLPLAWVYDRRSRLIQDLRNNLSTPAAGVMIASLLGDRYFLDKGTADPFREGGTYHILVISGLHITFIGALLLFFFRRFTRSRWIQFVLTTTVLWGYTLAVGAEAPVVRAAIMFTIISFSYVIYRQATLVNSLGACGLILLVWRPADLFTPSFQLTFVSVAAIIAMAHPLIDTLRKIGEWVPTATHPFPPDAPGWLRRLCETLYWREDAWAVESKREIWTAGLFKVPFMLGRIKGVLQKTAAYLFEGVLVSLIVQIWMLPLLVVYFHRVSPAAIVLNLWVSLFIALESFAAVIGVLTLEASSLLAAPFFASANVFNSLMLSLPQLVVDYDWASFRLPAYGGNGHAVYLLYFVPVVLLAVAVDRWRPFDLKQDSPWVRKRQLYAVSVAMTVLFAIVVFHPFSAKRPDGRLHIDFLDVGQGDAALVTFPDGKTLVVDGGGRLGYRSNSEDDIEPFVPDIRGVGEAVVSEFLWYQGLSHIDHILVTHAHADHMQGLVDVAGNFSVRSALVGQTSAEDPNFLPLGASLQRRRIPVEIIGRGDRLQFGDATVEVLYPPLTGDVGAASPNDQSIVLRITMGSRTFLMTGDIESGAETALLNGGGTLAADLIKVAHHGSRTSSTREFINAVGANYAVISVGRSSPFAHPHLEVVERWRLAGATVMTTGERGTISVSTDGKDLEITTFLP